MDVEKSSLSPIGLRKNDILQYGYGIELKEFKQASIYDIYSKWISRDIDAEIPADGNSKKISQIFTKFLDETLYFVREEDIRYGYITILSSKKCIDDLVTIIETIGNASDYYGSPRKYDFDPFIDEDTGAVVIAADHFMDVIQCNKKPIENSLGLLSVDDIIQGSDIRLFDYNYNYICQLRCFHIRSTDKNDTESKNIEDSVDE